MSDEKYMVYVNPYVGPEYYSGGWIIKLREGAMALQMALQMIPGIILWIAF